MGDHRYGLAKANSSLERRESESDVGCADDLDEEQVYYFGYRTRK